MELKDTNCKICGKDDYKLLWTKNSFNYVQCNNCRFIYINPRLSEKAISRLYNKSSLFKYKSERVNLLLENINSYKKSVIKSLEPFKKNKRLLDVGCFKGFFMYNASRLGWKAYGTDLSLDAAKFAKEKLGQDVIVKELEKANFKADFFDVVTLFDVVEHLPDPQRYVKECYRIIRDGGAVYIETPNFDSFTKRILGKRWLAFHMLHLCYFTPETIKLLLEKNGFKTKKVDTVGFFPFSTYDTDHALFSTKATKERASNKIIKVLSKSKVILKAMLIARDILKKAEEIPFQLLSAVHINIGTKIRVLAVKEK